MPGWGACEPSKRNCRFEDFSQTRTFGTDVLRAWREPGHTPCCGRVESAPRRAYIKNSEGVATVDDRVPIPARLAGGEWLCEAGPGAGRGEHRAGPRAVSTRRQTTIKIAVPVE